VTDGRFDPRVLRDLERLGDAGVPIDGAGPRHGPERPAGPVAAGSRAGLSITAPIDLGGVGKGLAARWAAARAMQRLGAAAGMLLDLGGDLVAAGTPVTDGWRVGIEDPIGEAPLPLVVVRLATGGLATSSVRNRTWRTADGRSVHHLIDPHTGAPGGAGLAAVTVAHPDPAWAEIWSKALFLAGAISIGEEARGRDLAAWWIDRDGRLAMTPAARQASAWVDETRLG
jgi:thiamine biosynthesis lipoprotein